MDRSSGLSATGAQFKILGPLRFERAGSPIDLGSFKQKSLLALLLVHANQVVSTDRIIDELWGEGGVGKQNALWVHVSNLRSAIEPDRTPRSEGTILLTRSPGYLLRVEPGDLDAGQFEQLVSEGRGLLSSDPPAAALVFAEALALWQGRVLEDFTYESFAQEEIRRLEAVRLDAVEGRIEADLARGLSHQLVGELQGLIREHPLRERFTALLMMALYRSQRQAEALRVYAQLRARLGTELGIEPSSPLRDLEEQIILGDPRLEPIPTTWVPGGPEPGLAVRGYEIRSNLGKTTFGSVYRAYQPAMGREVAIKVIRPELANDPGFVRRFEADANLIAGLESQQVVPIYDFWREPDAAFLVEKLITGGDLGQLLAKGPPSPDRVMAIVEQVARPLALAHGLGVAHGGLKLENVLLDEQGNARVTDFGIAAEGAASASTDIEALATMAAQLLTGRRGSLGELSKLVEGPAAGVLSSANDRSAFASLDSFVTAFRSAIGTDVSRDISIESASPYKGLEAFAESDTGHFFGRERLIERMLARLGGGGPVVRFLAVVGPSGSGKSSVVNAGLVPALRAGGVPGSDQWFIVTMTPGVHPFESMERALTKVAVKSPVMLLEQLLAEPAGLRRAVEMILPDQISPLILVIDQFEELYTVAADDERAAFTEALVEAIAHHRSRLRVVITLRADFYDHPLAAPGLGELLRDHTELVTPMTASELELAISRPAVAAGVAVQPALLAALVTDAASKPGALPMLQYTLTELFERKRGATMTASSYESMGGLTGAVVERAESLFNALTAPARVAARHVFLRLVSVNEAGEDTRRRVLLSELQELQGRDGYLDDMLRAFARHRLLTFDRDPASRGPTVEIAHEALIGAWSRLSSWIDEARDDLRAQRRLASVTADWIEQGRNPDFLLTGASLARYAAWDSDPPVRLTSAEHAFLGAAVEQQAQHERAAQGRLLRESQFRRRTQALVGLGVLSLLVVFLAGFAFSQRQEARDLAAQLEGLGQARLLAADSGKVISDDPDLAILLAVEAIRATEQTGEALPEAVDALHWALQHSTVAYPAADEGIPVAVRPHSSGPRGVFALPPADLVGLGRETVGRGFKPEECTTYFSSDGCPDPMQPVARDLAIAGGMDEYTGLADRDAALAGTTVVLTSAWNGPEAEAAALDLSALGAELGINVVYHAHTLINNPIEVALSDDPGDIVVLPYPGAIGEIARERPLVDLGAYLGDDYLRESFGNYLTDLSSYGGLQYGFFVRLGTKSMIWYNPEAFQTAGYVVPSTWDGLLELSDEMVRDGHTPWCLGVFSFEATGWPATDWLENFVIQSEGPEFYDAWTTHEIPFDHPAVVAALEKVGRLAHTPGYISSRAIEETSWDEAMALASQNPPQCWLLPYPDFAQGFFAEEQLAVMRFPAVNPAYSSSMEGGGDVAIAVSDRPEVRAVIRGLASPAWGRVWAETASNFFPAHLGFDLEAFGDPTRGAIAALLSDANDAGQFRFDASDQMPSDVVFGPLHQALTRYLSDPGLSARETLGEVEQAWTQYEQSQGDG
jgi:DNA-binding SARP family transcriptional activator/ABC-type glycerol-3-phosphate transport system substrate-binding protein